MNEHDAQEIAYRLMVVHLPASWIEVPANRLGDMKTSPKAIRLRDAIVLAMRTAYNNGVIAGKKEAGGGRAKPKQ